jgi:hypothetical protein
MKIITRSGSTYLLKKIISLLLLLGIGILQTINGQALIGDFINGEDSFDGSGRSIALSSDGNIVAIGATFNDGNGTSSGHVRIYQNQSGTWVQLGQDINGEASGDFFGWSVSLSDDGSIAAIGAIFNDGNGTSSGHVRIYQYQSNMWVLLGQDIDGESTADQSGQSISLSSDGSVLAIGATFNDGNGVSSGHVRIYQYQSNSWIQVGQDINGEDSGDESGQSVSMSSDGSIVAVGAINNNGSAAFSGHVRVYQNQSGTWVQIGQDIDGEAVFDESGQSVSLSSNGSIVAVGAARNDGNGTLSGHVRVYQNQSGTWVQIGQDIDGEANGDFSGSSVSLSSNGNIIAIGAPGNSDNGSSSGHVRIYQYLSNNWIQIGQDIDGEAGQADSDRLGFSVALSNNGSIVAIGAPGNDGGGTDSGHVRVYDLNAVLSTASLEFDESMLTIYPNPASDEFTIQNSESISVKQVAIYDLSGKRVKSRFGNGVISTVSIESGVYYVRITTEHGNITKKLIIQ